MSRSVLHRAALLIAAVGAVGASAFAVISEGETQARKAPLPPGVRTQIATSQLVSDWQEYSGRLEAIARVEIRPRVAGTLQSIHFHDGQLVKQGDLLFAIDPAPFEAELKRAQATLAQARDRQRFTQSELERGQRLLPANAIAHSEFDGLENAAREARSAAEAALAAAQRAQLDVDYTRITAPISGRISRAEVTPGNLVTAGGDATALTSIVTVQPIYAAFNADEHTYLHHIAANHSDAPQVQVGLADDSGYPHIATLHSVDNQLDLRSGTIRMRAIVANPDGSMIPGLQARVRLQTRSAYRAILVDETAIATDQDRRFVLVVGKEGRVEYRNIELGSRQGRQRVVRQGLQDGDRVIVEGAQRVKPGDLVRVEIATALNASEGQPR